MTARRIPPPPPAEPTGGQSCDGGYCDAPSVGWRWYVADRRWLPVCAAHIAVKGVPRTFRRYDDQYAGGAA